MRYLITGAAGFIGFHLARRLLNDGHEVLGLDGMTSYYDISLKERRESILEAYENYSFVQAALEDREVLESTIRSFSPRVVFHLAAQAGVRYSLENPGAYISSNVIGTFNLLEVLRGFPVEHLLIASTSSVYGGNREMPFSEIHRADFPVSLYAATKKACEVLSHSYSQLFGIPTTCFRFFTVYGPWGRPDMALFKFVDLIENGHAIEVYGEGDMQRDFTFVDDLVEGVVRLAQCVPRLGEPVGDFDSLSSVAPWRVVNIAGSQPVSLAEFIAAIEGALGKSAQKVQMPMQKGDVRSTYADTTLLHALTGYAPSVPISVGVPAFVDWYRTVNE